MDKEKLFLKQRQAVLDGRVDEAVAAAREAVTAGVDLNECIEEGYVAGIREVGRLWEEGEYFLPELMQGADAMKAAMGVLRPAFLAVNPGGVSGPKVVIGTVKGDIHDIGKTLVATFLEANGFVVNDLGRDVSAERFVDAVENDGAELVCLSALLTTTMPAQGDVVEMLKEKGLRLAAKVLVGGAPVTRAGAGQIGADGYAANAVSAVAEARRLAGGDA